MADGMGYGFLALALLLNALANVLIKVGAPQFGAVGEIGIQRAVLANPALLVGVALFALNVVFYALALSRIPLAVGYPVMVGGGLVLVSLISAVYLREVINAGHLFGIALIVVGAFFVVNR